MAYFIVELFAVKAEQLLVILLIPWITGTKSVQQIDYSGRWMLTGFSLWGQIESPRGLLKPIYSQCNFHNSQKSIHHFSAKLPGFNQEHKQCLQFHCVKAVTYKDKNTYRYLLSVVKKKWKTMETVKQVINENTKRLKYK